MSINEHLCDVLNKRQDSDTYTWRDGNITRTRRPSGTVASYNYVNLFTDSLDTCALLSGLLARQEEREAKNHIDNALFRCPAQMAYALARATGWEEEL